MLCLRVITPQLFDDVISTLQCNITVGPGRRVIPGVTMVEHACFSFTIKYDYGFEVYSPVDTLRGIIEYYSVSNSLYYLCIRPAQTRVEVLF